MNLARDLSKTIKNKAGLILLLTLISLVFLHNIKFTVVIFPVYLSDLLVGFYILSNLNYLFKTVLNNSFTKKIIRIFFALAFLNIFSVVYGMAFTKYPTGINDLIISFRYIYMIVLLIFGGMIYIKYRDISFIIQIIAFGIIIISFLEFFIPGFGILLKQHYHIVDETSFKLVQSNLRIIGPLLNSNNLGLISSLLLVILIFYEKKTLLNVSAIIGLIVTILLTGSRTGFGLLLFILLLFLITSYSSFKTFATLLIIGLGLYLFSIYIIDFSNSILYARVFGYGTAYLFQGRVDIYWDKTLDIIKDSPIIGVGLLGRTDWTADSFYLNLVKTNGIIGLFLFLYFLFTELRLSFKNKKCFEGKTLTAIISIIVISSVTADFYYSVLIYPIFFILIGYYNQRLLSQ